METTGADCKRAIGAWEWFTLRRGRGVHRYKQSWLESASVEQWDDALTTWVFLCVLCEWCTLNGSPGCTGVSGTQSEIDAGFIYRGITRSRA